MDFVVAVISINNGCKDMWFGINIGGVNMINDIIEVLRDELYVIERYETLGIKNPKKENIIKFIKLLEEKGDIYEC